MFINKIKNALILKRNFRNFSKKATLIGTDHIFGRGSCINITDGSTKNDIVIENHTRIFCELASQSGGQIHLGNYVKIGPHTHLQCVNAITIGDYTRIAINVFISDNNNHPINPDYRLFLATRPENDKGRRWIHSANAPIVIGRNCWIGQNVRIQKGVTIGDNSVIAANSVVTKDVPANAIAAGNPAKIVKTDIDQIPAPTTYEPYNEFIKKRNR